MNTQKGIRAAINAAAKKHAHFSHGTPNEVCTAFDVQELDYFVREIEALLASQRQSDKEALLGKLPEKWRLSQFTTDGLEYHEALGRNQAIDQVRKIIKAHYE